MSLGRQPIISYIKPVQLLLHSFNLKEGLNVSSANTGISEVKVSAGQDLIAHRCNHLKQQQQKINVSSNLELEGPIWKVLLTL